jgi:hypothetical protein
MTEHHDDDINLVNFLRQNRPQIPPTSPELEEKILQQVSQYQEKTGSSKRGNVISIPSFQSRFLYLFPSAIAAGIIIFISSYRLLTPQQSPSEIELSKIEAFMENNWHDSLSEKPETSSFLDD